MSWRKALVTGAVLLPVVVAGGLVVAWSLSNLPQGLGWVILAILTITSSFFVVKLPGVAATFTVSEAYVFAQILLFGPAAGALTGALDGLVMAIHRGNVAGRRLLFNVAEPALSVWAAAMTIQLLGGGGDASRPMASILATLAGTVVFVAMNVGLTGIAVATETGRSPFRAWFWQLRGLSVNYLAGAAVAVMIAFTPRPLAWFAVGLTLPILAVVYLTCRSATERLNDAVNHVREVNELYHSTIETLALAVDAKDQVTHGHIRRVQRNAATLARELGIEDEQQLQAINAAGLLHDMGKLAVPDYLLNKPGGLTHDEYEQVKRHATIGADMLCAVKFPYPVVPIVRHHHENWDGSGYPSGLSGSAIPIGARSLAVIDCYDALTSDRPYRRALSPSEAAEMIRQRSGTMYDPAVVEAFLRIRDKLECAGPDDYVRPDHHGTTATGVGPANRVCRDPQEIVQRLLNEIPAELVVYFRHDAASGHLSPVVALGRGADRVGGHRIRTGLGISGWVSITKHSIRNSNPALDFGAPRRMNRWNDGSALAIAVDLMKDASDVVTAYSSRRDQFSEADERLATSLVRQSMQHAAADPRDERGAARAHRVGLGVA